MPRRKLEEMEEEIRTLRNSKLYKRLLEFEESIAIGKKYTREDLGF